LLSFLLYVKGEAILIKRGRKENSSRSLLERRKWAILRPAIFSMKEKVLLVSYPESFILSEAMALCEAADFEVVSVVTQRYLLRAKYGVGSGKAEEIKSIVEREGIKKIVFDESLKTVQSYNLAKLSGVEVVDRERLILDIFNKRATSVESKLQVKLAELRYELPKSREKVRLAKTAEQPGFFGLGKYEVDTYFRAIRRQVVTINRKLQSVLKRKHLFQSQRERLGLPVASLAGYTGAGKTTLFNAFTGETKEISPGVFTTLSTSTRGILIDSSKILLSDTVGFISRLPAYMIDAFKSTLEELRYSDLVMLVVDSSERDDVIGLKLETCLKTLSDLEVQDGKILILFNKIDKIGGKPLLEQDGLVSEIMKKNGVRLPYLRISARTREGLDRLQKYILERVLKPRRETITVSREVANSVETTFEWLKQNAIVSVSSSGDSLSVDVSGPAWVIDHFKRLGSTSSRE
jgi:GTP-binding protein HflX